MLLVVAMAGLDARKIHNVVQAIVVLPVQQLDLVIVTIPVVLVFTTLVAKVVFAKKVILAVIVLQVALLLVQNAKTMGNVVMVQHA